MRAASVLARLSRILSAVWVRLSGLAPGRCSAEAASSWYSCSRTRASSCSSKSTRHPLHVRCDSRGNQLSGQSRASSIQLCVRNTQRHLILHPETGDLQHRIAADRRVVARFHFCLQVVRSDEAAILQSDVLDFKASFSLRPAPGISDRRCEQTFSVNRTCLPR